MEHDETGLVTKIERVENEDGKIVLRATVDFIDGNCPPLTFATIWGKVPVRIVPEAKS